jgi:hypothetical protein
LRYVSIDGVRDTLPGVIARKGRDYVYPHLNSGCTYVRDGKPDCLVGCYLIDVLSIPMEYFEEVDPSAMDYPTKKNSLEFNLIADEIGERFGIIFDPDAVEALREVQDCQDSGHTWGDSYDAVFNNDPTEEED